LVAIFDCNSAQQRCAGNLFWLHSFAMQPKEAAALAIFLRSTATPFE